MPENDTSSGLALAPIGKLDTIKVNDLCWIGKLPTLVDADTCTRICQITDPNELRCLVERIEVHVGKLYEVSSRLRSLRPVCADTVPAEARLQHAIGTLGVYSRLALLCLGVDSR